MIQKNFLLLHHILCFQEQKVVIHRGYFVIQIMKLHLFKDLEQSMVLLNDFDMH